MINDIKFHYMKNMEGKIEMYANGVYINTFDNFTEIFALQQLIP
jgi:hypothetical protein